MDGPTEGSSWVEGNSPPSPGRLCQACLSVLTRSDLEYNRLYPHHSSPESLIEAANMQCYICSWLISSLNINEYEGIKQVAGLKDLAENEVPGRLAADETHFPIRSEDELERHWNSYVERDQGQSWISFTDIALDRAFEGNSSEVHAQLNPWYEHYVPLHLSAYSMAIKILWIMIQIKFFDASIEAPGPSPVFVPQEGMPILAPTLITWQTLFSSDLDFNAMGMPRDLCSNTGSIEAWATVEAWMQECSEQHQCLANIDTNWYPTRLVEWLPNERFRVVHSDSISFTPGHGYITLSHRWGKSTFEKLTTESLSCFQDGRPISILQKTFQDTLLVAQRMHVRYVWIDSLCIIQDGDGGEDWRRESATMALVYTNSLCNISADWGDESNGLFFKRSPPFDAPYPVEIGSNDVGASDTICTPSQGGHGPLRGYIVPRTEQLEIISTSPLNSRGWVLQERLLAPRVLHFSPRQISWECSQQWKCERLASNLIQWPSSRALDYVPPSRRGDDMYWHDACESMKRPNLQAWDLADWVRLVKQYSGCDLTYQSDKLVAISGIVRKLRSVVKDQYVAGLWAKYLPQELLWRREDGDGCRDYPSHYYAPTFSWAAADGAVYILTSEPTSFWSYRYRNTASAQFIRHRKKSLPPSSHMGGRESHNDEILTEDVFGPLASPVVEIRLRGILRSCRRLENDPDGPMFHPYPLPDSWGSNLNPDFSGMFDRAKERFAEVDSSTLYFAIIQVEPDSGEAWDSVDVGLDWDRRSKYMERHQSASGLILRSVDASMGRFERLGRFNHQSEGGKISILRQLGNERDLPAWSFDERSGEHTFYIV